MSVIMRLETTNKIFYAKHLAARILSYQRGQFISKFKQFISKIYNKILALHWPYCPAYSQTNIVCTQVIVGLKSLWKWPLFLIIATECIAALRNNATRLLSELNNGA